MPGDRPIIFSAPMVRALLEGRKTQTRRLLKPMNRWVVQDCREVRLHDGRWCHFLVGAAEPLQRLRLPWAPGDRLWVRETWKPHSTFDHLPPRKIPKSNTFYLADDRYSPSGSRWRPSIHMPRWASRITLAVTDVRVQRLQEISEEDALAEGAQMTGKMTAEECEGHAGPHARLFADLWNSLHGPGAWDANPWVVALTFTVARQNIDMGGASHAPPSP